MHLQVHVSTAVAGSRFPTKRASPRSPKDRGPGFPARTANYFVVGMHIIIGMPPHIIIMGAPIAIIDCMASQRSFMRGIIDASVGIIFMTMPSFVISQDIEHIIGIMPLIIIGIIAMPMPGIMPFIIIGIIPMPPIIDGIIMPFIPCIPFMPLMPFIIGMFIGIMLFIGIMGPFIIGIAFMVSSTGCSGARTVLPAPRRVEAIASLRASFRLLLRTGIRGFSRRPEPVQPVERFDRPCLA